jgi:hypothetical protein
VHVEPLRAQLELEGFKKWYCDSLPDRLQSAVDLTQLLLTFAEEVDSKQFIRMVFQRMPNHEKNCGRAILCNNGLFIEIANSRRLFQEVS